LVFRYLPSAFCTGASLALPPKSDGSDCNQQHMLCETIAQQHGELSCHVPWEPVLWQQTRCWSLSHKRDIEMDTVCNILTAASKLRLSSAGSLAYTHCTFFMVSGSMNGETHFHRPLHMTQACGMIKREQGINRLHTYDCHAPATFAHVTNAQLRTKTRTVRRTCTARPYAPGSALPACQTPSV
jgi:hypothetical protein